MRRSGAAVSDMVIALLIARVGEVSLMTPTTSSPWTEPSESVEVRRSFSMCGAGITADLHPQGGDSSHLAEVVAVLIRRVWRGAFALATDNQEGRSDAARNLHHQERLEALCRD
jgi:hypothetical protein